jgi:crossover junction endodeoxyribonuclease RusA
MIELPFPDKALWPNGRAHWATKSRAFAKHKRWAFNAVLAEYAVSAIRTMNDLYRDGWPVRLRYTITPKTAHPIDRDNAVAAMKAYQDGIALAIGVDDSAFAVPEIVFTPPKKPGKVEVTL